jgi:hypothetical protein
VVKTMRAEQEIFDELARLCASPGYAHAIAYLCCRDNMIRYSGEMKAEDMQHLFSKSRLIRTETSTLIGLMLKSPIDYTLPQPPVLEKYIEATEALLEEIHHAMAASLWLDIDPTKIAEAGFNPFTSAAALREPIFYSGESAYSFQYRDFSPAKYANDEPWLIANKGFSIHEARNVVFAVSRLQDEKAIAVVRAMRGKPQETRTFLPGNAFSVQEVADHGHIDPVIVDRVLSAFAIPPGATNEQFKALHDFNIANASPLIRMPDGNFLLFHIYSLVEALYEAPFYWMGADKAFVSTAMRNRGVFVEQFAVGRLRQVFGAENVLVNIDIYESKDTKLAEIDVLVLFGNRALVLQAKSKRLTFSLLTESLAGYDNEIFFWPYPVVSILHQMQSNDKIGIQNPLRSTNDRLRMFENKFDPDGLLVVVLILIDSCQPSAPPLAAIISPGNASKVGCESRKRYRKSIATLNTSPALEVAEYRKIRSRLGRPSAS